METYLTQITNYLLVQSWQIAILVLVVALVSWLLKNRSAHIRYLLWLIVLAKCLVPLQITVPVAVLPQEKFAPVLETATMPKVEPHPLPLTPIPPVPTQTVAATPTRPSPRQWMGLAWIVGVATFVFVAIIKALRIQFWLRKKRKPLPAELQVGIGGLFSGLGLKRFPKVWLIDGIGQPFVWGLLRGGIYLPDGFVKVNNTELRKGILGHELSHILRFDAAVNLLQVISQAIFWFHPFVWWANKRIRSEREKCCDEMAIARLNTKVKDYSRAIVDTLVTEYESTRPVPTLAIAGPVKNIEERVKTIMKPGKKFYKRPSLIALTVVLLLALSTVPTALVLTARGQEKSSTKKEEVSNALVKAEEDERLERVKKFIARVDDINARDTWGYTFLHRACMEGEKQVAELLIAKGADVNTRTIVGITPLHLAAGRGHRDIVEVLLDKQADVNAEDDHGATSLWYAKNGVVYSFSTFGRFNKSLWNPESPGCKEIVELLRKLRAKEKAPAISLHEAAKAGLMDQVKSLVSKGADVNAMDDRLAGTPLHLAAFSGHREVIEFLIANDADVNARNKWDRTPLHVAIDRGRAEIVELLCKHGAKVETSAETTNTMPAKLLFVSVTSRLVIPETSLEIPERMTCAANLRKIHTAIKKYEKDKGKLPAWLSDLVPSYVSEDVLLCPNDPKAKVNWPADPKLPCGYTYQFCLDRQQARLGGAPTDGMTMRDRKVAQVKLFGDVVPLCSCRWDPRRNLNISVGGDLYLSGRAWEYTIMPDYKVGSELQER